MISNQTLLKVGDNSGAKTVKCIKVLGGFKKKYAKIGDIIIVTIKELRNQAKDKSKVKKKDIYRALIIRTKRGHKRKTAFQLQFSENTVILINKFGNPVGTRIIGPMPRHLLKKQYTKFTNICSGTIN